MASKTVKKDNRRSNRDAKQGKDRKRKLRVNGSTPAFPLDPPK
jgi:hypothetical protein